MHPYIVLGLIVLLIGLGVRAIITADKGSRF